MDFDETQRRLVEIAKARSAQSPWLTVEQLAIKFNVTVRTIRRLHEAKLGPPRVKRSRRWVYDRAAVEEWERSSPWAQKKLRIPS